MAKKTYRGSCHCGRVKLEADIDFSQGTAKCNCTSCWKRRWWSVSTKVEDFRLLQGGEELVDSRTGTTNGRGGFCRHCGVIVYRHIEAAEWNDGEYMSISVAALDDLDPAELLGVQVQYMDGRADLWWQEPAEARHL